jgi:tRNA-Thr(GGU) m(6)t(6)A37 methyltransferase TsaA
MISDTFTFTRIGTIHTPFREAAGTPIQPVFGAGVEGVVEVDAELAPGLDDLDGFERVWLVYALDRAGPCALSVVPYRDVVARGVFATRAPSRPNGIGLSVVRLIAREGARLRVADLDVLDGTPLLDIKPYVPSVDAFPGSRDGWFGAGASTREEADGRFHRS